MGRSIWAGDASRPSPATVASSDLLLVTEAPSRRGAHAEFPTPSGLPNIIFPPRPGTRDAASPRGLQAPDLQSRGQEKLPPSCPKHKREGGSHHPCVSRLPISQGPSFSLPEPPCWSWSHFFRWGSRPSLAEDARRDGGPPEVRVRART